jgi:predicted metalloprotease with PDZ domain
MNSPTEGATVNCNRLIRLWPALLACTTLAAVAPAAPAVADPPPAASGSAHEGSSADLDAQLDAARRRLEQAANEVARLSAQLSTATLDRVMPLFEPPRAVIGVELDPAGAGAGARVREVSPGGPAAEAGIVPGDVIVGINGTAVTGADPTRQVVTLMRDVKPDSRVRVRVLRDGKPREYVITTRPGPTLFAATDDLPDIFYGALPKVRGAFMLRGPLTDMELVTLTPRLGSYFGTDKGVLVVRAPADGTLKLEDGDVILAIDGRQPSSGSHATRILGSYQPGEKITLRILRQHKTLEIEATLPDGTRPAHRELREDGSAAERRAPPPRAVISGSGAA